MTHDELREAVARATYEEKRARLLNAFGDDGGWPEWATLKPTLREIEMENNDLAISIIRPAVLEEAAKVAESVQTVEIDGYDYQVDGPSQYTIADAIRALKEDRT